MRGGCGSSIMFPRDADVAQLVEHDLAKVGVAGSNPVVRSIVNVRPVTFQLLTGLLLDNAPSRGDVAKW